MNVRAQRYLHQRLDDLSERVNNITDALQAVLVVVVKHYRDDHGDAAVEELEKKMQGPPRRAGK